jgi:hypothetical protein
MWYQLANGHCLVIYSEILVPRKGNGRPPVVGATDGHHTHSLSHEYNRGPPACTSRASLHRLSPWLNKKLKFVISNVRI